jgi:hypothetical protein
MPKPRVAKKHLKANRDPYKKMSSEEIRVARMWHTEDHMEPCEIAGLLRRDTSTMTRLLVLRKERQQQGRPVAVIIAVIVAGASTGTVTPQLLHSYFTVTSQLLHSYFMWNLRQEEDYCVNSNNINAFIMISSISV